MDDTILDGFRRALDRTFTSDERTRLQSCAMEIHAEQLSGHEITVRVFLIRLMVEGLGMEKDEAAITFDQAMAGIGAPAELRQAMN